MINRFGGGVLVALVLMAMLAVEWVGLPAGTIGVVLVGGVIALAAVLLLVRAELRRAGVIAACAASFTLTWNGWYVGPVRPGDVLVLVALICLVVADPSGALRTPPWWVKQLGGVVLLVAAINVAFPADVNYLARRVVLTATGLPAAQIASVAGTNLAVAFKFVVAVVAIPMAFVGAARVDRSAVRWLAVSFVGGAALSGTAASLDYLGVPVGQILTGIPRVPGRQLGFSDHPNFLAAGLVLGIPLAYWLLASRQRHDKLLGLATMPGLLFGVFASGSRGGAVCVVLALALSVILHPRTRGYAPGILLAGAIAVGAIAAFVPSFGLQILRVTRLSGGVATAGSDTVRAAVGAQGLRDFHHSPIQGIGLQASFDASQVYIQELASGGLLLFIAMSVYSLGGIIAAARLIRRDDLAAGLLAALLATLALNVFEADLTDRFYYVPAAILVALIHIAKRDAVSPQPVVRLQPEPA